MLVRVSSARMGLPNRRRRIEGRKQLWLQLTDANERIAAHLADVDPTAPVPAIVAQDLHLIVGTLQDLLQARALGGSLRTYVAGHAPSGRPDQLTADLKQLRERVSSLEAMTTPPPHDWIEAIARPAVGMSVAAMVGAVAAGVPTMMLSGGDAMKIADAAIGGVAGAIAAMVTPSRITKPSPEAAGPIAPTASARVIKKTTAPTADARASDVRAARAARTDLS